MPQNARDLFHGRGFQLPEWVPWSSEYIQYFDSQSVSVRIFDIFISYDWKYHLHYGINCIFLYNWKILL